MTRRKGTTPEQYAGVFQQYDSIPARYRLETYSGHYRDENTWNRYCEQVLFERFDSDYIRKSARRAGDSWLNHMTGEESHHALATPKHVDCWCDKLLNKDRNRRTCYENYFVRIYNFYEYLKSSYRHPHHYNPLLLAAIEFETTRYIWLYRVESRPEVVDRE